MTPARLLDRMGGAFGRGWRGMEKRLPAIGLWVLIVAGVGVYVFAVILAGLAVFRDYLPDWLTEEIRIWLFAGNKNVELSLGLLAEWGLVDLLKNSVFGALIFAVAVVGLLILLNLVMLWAKRRKQARIQEAAKARQMPKIRLKNPVIVMIDEAGLTTKHRYSLHISLVVRKARDVEAVVETVATLRPFLTAAAEAVIRSSYARVDPERMAEALTRAAIEATAQAVDHIELIDLTHIEIDKATGEIVSGKGAAGRAAKQQSVKPEAAAAAKEPQDRRDTLTQQLDRLAAAKAAKAAAADKAAGFRTTLLPPSEIGGAAVPSAAVAGPKEPSRKPAPARKTELEPGAALARLLPTDPEASTPAAGPDAAPAASPATDSPAAGATPEPAPADPPAEEQTPEAAAGIDIRKVKAMMSGLRSDRT
ncbi:MAG: hypothetical protein HYR63_21425 [Proteobacteria bacterium]|nr:hypothetical protein [Pseudomonadota bacterium]MBI3500116.1 hypothetical protein [Pseudomonadota bacterium]